MGRIVFWPVKAVPDLFGLAQGSSSKVYGLPWSGRALEVSIGLLGD